MKRASVLLLALVAALVSASCEVNEYCVTCATEDGGGNGDPVDSSVIDTGVPDSGDDGDGGPPDAICFPELEKCDGVDNDCDSKTDESTTAEPLPEVGAVCGGTMGVCTPGTISCVDGELECSGVDASGEVCNNLDDDCDGTIDDGDPGGGSPCAGQCGPGINRCVSGAVTCQVSQQPTSEICDGFDNDCNGTIDDNLGDLGACGVETGECRAGDNECRGGNVVCIGAQGPVTEICDTLDQDCDGNPRNGFDLNNDVRNCGACNRTCSLSNATAACSGGNCVIGACSQDFHNADGNPANGCEYGPCQFRGPQEACNGADDDCDSRLDEGAVAPNICANLGECAAGPGGRPRVTATCEGVNGWDCNYEPDTRRDVSVDANGDLIPETECDGLDNDCDGAVDESHPNKGRACSDSGQGACQRTGTLGCNTADEDGPLICQLTGPVPTPVAETCDGIDNNCNGVIDDPPVSGVLPGRDWVSIGGGREIMKYEASRPDARAAVQGVQNTHACSRTGVLPWINVKQPEAEAVCTAMGARLCTEQEWQRACSVVSSTTYPVVEPATNNGYMYIEAESYATRAFATSGGVVRAWVPDTTTGFSGMSGLRASPNTGANVSQANAPTEAPRLDFPVTITTGGDHFVWVKLNAAGGGDDSVWVGISNTTPGTAQQQINVTADNTWRWVRSNAINVATGGRVVSVYMREDGVKIDAVVITRLNSFTAPTETSLPGRTWAYQTGFDAARPGVCNGDALDTDGTAGGDQDDIIATGARAECNAEWGGTSRIFNLSGNVREWTAERLPAANPIRGGTSNNIEDGLKCGLSFTLADDDFFFPNVGFRCCR